MDRIGKIMVVFLIMLGIITGIMLFLFFSNINSPADRNNETSPVSSAGEIVEKEAYEEDFLPEKLKIGSRIPLVYFRNRIGENIDISTLVNTSKNGLWLSFSESDNHLSNIETLSNEKIESLAEISGISLYVIDDFSSADDPTILFDKENAAETWGIQKRPTDLIINKNGILLEFHTGLLNVGEAEGMMKRALQGRDEVGFSFISEKMSNQNGGFFTNAEENPKDAKSPSGRDILSESQGFVMQYAVIKNDQELFDDVWNFTKTNLFENGLTAWYVSEDGKKASANALLDDLRIWASLYSAGEMWNTRYRDDALELQTAIKKYCLDKKGRIVDFVDLNNGNQADTISLQYSDIVVLKKMAETDAEFEAAYNNAVNILLDGRISDQFPLYYKSYNYKTRSYDTGNLNAAEALYTLWNLSRAGLLPDDAFQWVKERVIAGTLGARYRTNGDIVFGYDFHSTAVYGLAALIAMEANDDEMLDMALRRMERKFVLDSDDQMFGAYTQKGAVVYSFDQLLPLLVNANLKMRLDGEH